MPTYFLLYCLLARYLENNVIVFYLLFTTDKFYVTSKRNTTVIATRNLFDRLFFFSASITRSHSILDSQNGYIPCWHTVGMFPKSSLLSRLSFLPLRTHTPVEKLLTKWKLRNRRTDSNGVVVPLQGAPWSESQKPVSHIHDTSKIMHETWFTDFFYREFSMEGGIIVFSVLIVYLRVVLKNFRFFKDITSDEFQKLRWFIIKKLSIWNGLVLNWKWLFNLLFMSWNETPREWCETEILVCELVGVFEQNHDRYRISSFRQKLWDMGLVGARWGMRMRTYETFCTVCVKYV